MVSRYVGVDRDISVCSDECCCVGIPFNDTTHLRLQIAEAADAILGYNVLGYQVGNEPDLYASWVGSSVVIITGTLTWR